MKSFDWVPARAACSAKRAFEQLKLDVKARLLLRPQPTHYLFEFTESGNLCSVFLAGNGVPHAAARFELSDNGMIIAEDARGQKIEAGLTLSDDGECRLKVKGQEREFWQFRKMALEALFFEFV